MGTLTIPLPPRPERNEKTIIIIIKIMILKEIRMIILEVREGRNELRKVKIWLGGRVKDPFTMLGE